MTLLSPAQAIQDSSKITELPSDDQDSEKSAEEGSEETRIWHKGQQVKMQALHSALTEAPTRVGFISFANQEGIRAQLLIYYLNIAF